jgi:hypothetical protein
MKTLIKIAALAAVAAFAVFSCAPEPELTGVDWKKVNSKFDPGKNTWAGLPEGFSIPSLQFKTGDNEVNELTITFPKESDFLKAGKGKVEAGMKEFLSFHHFEKTSVDSVTELSIAGKADTIGAPLAYTLVRQNVNVITLRLTKKFVAGDSSVIMKIDGTKYTYAGGVKLDLVGRGGGGEAGYDDVYVEFPVIITDPDPEDPEPGPSNFVGPNWNGGLGMGLNHDWSFTLAEISPYAADEDGILEEYPVARLSLPGIYSINPDEVSAIYTAVANRLKAGLGIQKFEEEVWVDVGGVTFTYDYDLYRTSVYVDTLTLENITPFRVVWKGSAPVTTADAYFGVKQFVKIIGENTTPWSPAYYRTGTVYGPVTGGLESRNFLETFIVSIYSKDSFDRNVVIDVLFNEGRGIGDGESARWLKDFNYDKETFKENFKIAYYRDANGVPGDATYPYNTPAQNEWWPYATNLAYIPIKDLQMRSFNPNEAPDIGLNMVRITLDPDYKWVGGTRYFHISPEIGYTDNKTVYGDFQNFKYNFFKEYTITTVEQSKFLDFAPPIPLTVGVWAEGNLTVTTRDVWYSFPVTDEETYYIWVDDRKDGRVPTDKTGDVVIAAQYRGDNAWISGIGNTNNATDGNWALPASFTATKTGIVKIRVRLFNQAITSVGTYGIVYDTIDTRPGYEWTVPVGATVLEEDKWADGNIATPGGEQWFTFTATAASQYIHAATGTTSDFYVELYDNDGTRVGARATIPNNTTQRPVVLDDPYFIRVFATTGTARGTFRIAFSKTSTTPAVDVPADCPELEEGVWTDGSISTADPERWYKFDATATPQYIHASFGTLTQMSVQLYTDKGLAVAGTGTLTATATSLNRAVTDGDTYYIKVRQNIVNGTPVSGTYKIMFNKRTSVPVTLPSATELTFDVWADGNISMGTREQWYKFTATTTLHYIHVDTRTALKAQAFDSDGYSLGSAAFGPIQITVTEDDTYFMKITPNVANSIIGDYRIKFNGSVFPVWPPEDCTQLTVNRWEDGEITEPGGIQWFSFTATDSTQYIHFIWGTLSDIYVQLYTEAGGLQGIRTNAYSSTVRVDRTGLTVGDTYYINITPYSASRNGTYRILFSPNNSVPIDLPDDDDVIELFKDVWQDGDIPAAGGQEWFKFEATATTQYLHFKWGTLNDINVQLYADDGYVVLSGSGNTTGTTNLYSGTTRTSRTGLTVGDTYYIRVWPWSSSGKGTYQIAFNEAAIPPAEGPWTPPATTTGLSNGVMVYPYITASSTGLWYSFTVTAGTTYYVFWEDYDTYYSDFDIEVAAYYSDGTVIFVEDGGEDWECWTYFEAESTGTVYIKVYPSDWNDEYSGYIGIGYSTSPGIDRPFDSKTVRPKVRR